jgi:hypothetical protein
MIVLAILNRQQFSRLDHWSEEGKFTKGRSEGGDNK